MIFCNKYLFRNLSQLFSNVSYSEAVWLMFIETHSHLEDFFAFIDIPFDCEFLIACLKDDGVINLTEVYRVSSTLPLQTYPFGNWVPSSGLVGPELGFYQRRNNLQKLALKTTVRQVSGIQIIFWEAEWYVSHVSSLNY